MKGVLLLVFVSLSACAQPQISIPVGTASIMYAHALADITLGKYVITRACLDRKLDESTCAGANDIYKRALVYQQSIEAALMNSTQPIDWAQILKYGQDVSQLLLSIGVLVP